MSPKAARSIPVRIESRSRPKKKPVAQPVPAAPAAKPEPAPDKVSMLRQPVHELPTKHRQRLMWGMVAIGLFVVVLGWAMTLGYELRNPNREFSLFRDLANVFRSYQLTNPQTSTQDQEIQQLQDQVFPQF